FHLESACDFFATEWHCVGARVTFVSNLGLHSNNIPSPATASFRLGDETHICTSARTRRPRFTGQENPVPTVCKATAPNRPAIQGRDRHEARRRHCGNHEAGGDRNPLRLSGQSSH